MKKREGGNENGQERREKEIWRGKGKRKTEKRDRGEKDEEEGRGK